MRKRIIFGMAALLMAMSLSACNSTPSGGESKGQESSTPISVDPETEKKVEVSNITLSNQDDKAYITVTGKVTNYTNDDFTWAWGLKDQSSGQFHDGKEKPEAADFKKAKISNNNSFTIRILPH